MNIDDNQKTSEAARLVEAADSSAAKAGPATSQGVSEILHNEADNPPQDRANECKVESDHSRKTQSPDVPKQDSATIGGISLQLQAMQSNFDALNQQIQTLTRNQDILQSALRKVVTTVADAANSLAAPRIRELYLRLLMIYDLVSPAPAELSKDASEVCNMIAVQIEQFLAVNGFERIPSDNIAFDSKQHKIGKIEVVDAPELDGQILLSLQHGFRSGQCVLRPSTVVMGRKREQPRDSNGDVAVPGSTFEQENQLKSNAWEKSSSQQKEQ